MIPDYHWHLFLFLTIITSLYGATRDTWNSKESGVGTNKFEFERLSLMPLFRFHSNRGDMVLRNVIEVDPQRMLLTQNQINTCNKIALIQTQLAGDLNCAAHILVGEDNGPEYLMRTKREVPPPTAIEPPSDDLAQAQSFQPAVAPSSNISKTSVTNRSRTEIGRAALSAVPPLSIETTLRPDEMSADTRTDTRLQGDAGHYPKMITPNVTCITTDDAKHRMKGIAAEFGVRPNRKCPKHLPCQQYMSCNFWRSGIVTRSFSIDKASATIFYSELFAWLHERKISEILRNFEECIDYYGLDQPFVGSQKDIASNDTGIQHNKKKKRKKHKLQPPMMKRETREDSGGDDDAAATINPKAGLGDCLIRIEDFLECFDTVMLKALCYWPTLESA